MKIVDYLKKAKDYPGLWAINILSSAAWLIYGNALVKACASLLTVLVILIIDIVFSEDLFPYARFIPTILIVNCLAGFLMMLGMDDPAFHGCLPSFFYIAICMIFYMVYLFMLVAGGFVVLMVKNSLANRGK